MQIKSAVCGKKDNFLVQGRKVGNCVPIRIVRKRYALLSAYCWFFVGLPTVGGTTEIIVVERGGGGGGE